MQPKSKPGGRNRRPVSRPAKWTRLAAGCLPVIGALCLAEISFWALGHQPGRLRGYTRGAPVAQLHDRYRFVTDEDGVLKADPNWPWEEPYRINRDGFRGEEFDQNKGDRPGVLLLGDSFAWGLSASPITESFGDLVNRSGYRVFNTGIGGVDPSQYLFLTKEYTRRLRPAAVVVAFYMGNDLARPREVAGDKPAFYTTGSILIRATDRQGRHLSFSQAVARNTVRANLSAYELARSDGGLGSMMKRVLLRTRVGTLLVVAGWEIGPVAIWEHAVGRLGFRTDDRQARLAGVRDQLMQMRDHAVAHDAEFLLLVIPVDPRHRHRLNSIENNREAFAGLDPYIPTDLTTADYVPPPNGHLNNDGHQKLSRYLVSALRSLGV